MTMAPNQKSNGQSLNEFNSDKKNDKKELLCDGVFYDVTQWIRRHPGGNIINLYIATGEDSKHAVEQFHLRSIDRVMSIMRSLPKRPASPSDLVLDIPTQKKHKELDKDFLKLFKELKEEGFFEPNLAHVLIRLIEPILLMIIWTMLLTLENPHLILRIIGICLVALGTGRTGWIQHEGGHRSLTGIGQVDRIIMIIILGAGYGLSGSWWASQHNRHHAMPNHVKHDVDMETLPLVAFNKKVVRKPEQGKTFWIRNQQWLFLIVTFPIVQFVWRYIQHPLYCLHKGKYLELTFIMLSHHMSLYIIGFTNYIIVLFLTATYLFGNFALSHTHLPVTTEPTHWVEYSLTHTTNIKSSWWVDYWMGHLNNQIEHHLFPTMPQYRNKLASRRVKELAKKHNLPYNIMSYKEAVMKTFQNLGQVAEELKK